MIVDDVEVDHELPLMRVIDQRFELVRRAIGSIRCERQRAVIAPVALPREIVDRHELDGGDADAGQTIEIRLH